MKIKETMFNITIVVVLLAGVIVSLMYGANRHYNDKQREKFVKDSIANTMSTEYQFTVTDDSLTVYDGKRAVGTIKIDGTLDSLINLDNL